MEFRVPFTESDSFDCESWTLDENRNVRNTSDIGYVPLEKRLRALLQAGERLQEFRESMYEIGDDFDEDSDWDSDPTLDLDFNEMDAKIEMNKLEEKYREPVVLGVSELPNEEAPTTEDSSVVSEKKENEE